MTTRKKSAKARVTEMLIEPKFLASFDILERQPHETQTEYDARFLRKHSAIVMADTPVLGVQPQPFDGIRTVCVDSGYLFEVLSALGKAGETLRCCHGMGLRGFNQIEDTVLNDRLSAIESDIRKLAADVLR